MQCVYEGPYATALGDEKLEWRVTDGQTKISVAYMRYSMYAVTRKISGRIMGTETVTDAYE